VTHIAQNASTPDLEAWEEVIRQAVLAAGARLLGKLLRPLCVGRQAQRLLCSCGQPMDSRGLKSKILLCSLGSLPLERSLFQCPACGKTAFPVDRLLNIEHTGFSPAVRRWMARAGSRASFVEAEEDLRAYTGLSFDRRDIERVAEETGRQIDRWQARCNQALLKNPPADPLSIPLLYISFDGTAIPMHRSELIGRKGKGPSGQAKGREVKLGCVFTQTTTDAEGRPIRDEDSTTYVGAIESSALFGHRLYAEAVRRGLNQAQKVVTLTDGAAYNRTLIEEHFPQAIAIIDLYHAREHLHALHQLLAPADLAVLAHWLTLLDVGKAPTLAEAARARLPRNGPRRKEALLEIGYFIKNAQSMRYSEFRAQGLFIGSGVIEAGCRSVIGKRLKQSGMFWSVAGANAIIASRCCLASGRFDEFWESSVA
jgi:hypothetical protein